MPIDRFDASVRIGMAPVAAVNRVKETASLSVL